MKFGSVLFLKWKLYWLNLTFMPASAGLAGVTCASVIDFYLASAGTMNEEEGPLMASSLFGSDGVGLEDLSLAAA